MKTLHRAFCIAPLALIASQAGAQNVGASPSEPTEIQDTRGLESQRSAAKPTDALEAPAILSLDDLAKMRGGEQTAISQQTFISDNSAGTINGDFIAGDVSISDNALSNFNGLGNIVINTGAQSTLQAGLGVTINISD
ncbi:MAG: hypothetical protein AAF941_03055 [Pseudomonadota bacterium]